jgi:hypothetical protein
MADRHPLALHRHMWWSLESRVDACRALLARAVRHHAAAHCVAAAVVVNSA